MSGSVVAITDAVNRETMERLGAGSSAGLLMPETLKGRSPSPCTRGCGSRTGSTRTTSRYLRDSFILARAIHLSVAHQYTVQTSSFFLNTKFALIFPPL